MLKNFNRNIEIADGLETQSVRILYYEFSDRLKDSYKSYEYNRLCTILHGEKKVSINGKDAFTYDKDKFLLLPSNSSVDMEIAQSTKALVLELSDDLVEKTNNKISSHFDLPNDFRKEDLFVGDKHGSIEYCLNRISNALANTKEKDLKFLLDLYVQELVYFLLKEKGVSNILSKPTDHPISQAISLMKSNLSPAINLELIASSVNLSLPSFSRKFKDVVGLTPKNYYTHLKLVKSKELLQEKTVNETAWDLGFDNVGHFIKLFKKRFFITPKEYQLQQISRPKA